MKLSKLKKYIFYLTALMPFIMMLLGCIYYSFTNQVLDMTQFSFFDTIISYFITVCEGFIPNFVDLGEVIYTVFGVEGLWGDALLTYFIYFVAIVLYNVLINILLFLVYIFESWVNKLEKDF